MSRPVRAASSIGQRGTVAAPASSSTPATTNVAGSPTQLDIAPYSAALPANEVNSTSW